MTKTKQMLRQKYWFPEMNKQVELVVGQCYECQVTTLHHDREPLKMTKIPEKPWQTVSVDFGGPYPDGHYNLVIIDKRTRYPEVEVTYSTAAKPTKEKLKRYLLRMGHLNNWKQITDRRSTQKNSRISQLRKGSGTTRSRHYIRKPMEKLKTS